MIQREEIQEIINGYDPKKVTLGIFGSHSALEAGMSAKDFDMPTMLFVQDGRDATYAKC